jgi:hypothetical protein
MATSQLGSARGSQTGFHRVKRIQVWRNLASKLLVNKWTSGEEENHNRCGDELLTQFVGLPYRYLEQNQITGDAKRTPLIFSTRKPPLYNIQLQLLPIAVLRAFLWKMPTSPIKINLIPYLIPPQVLILLPYRPKGKEAIQSNGHAFLSSEMFPTVYVGHHSWDHRRYQSLQCSQCKNSYDWLDT